MLCYIISYSSNELQLGCRKRELHFDAYFSGNIGFESTTTNSQQQ